MFVWQYSETIETHAAAENIWKLWSDPASWHMWDSEVKFASIAGGFIQGAKGVMQPASGPRTAFELIHVDVNKSFTNRAKLPLATLDFSHVYTPPPTEGNPANITHNVEIRGLLAPLFGVLIGRGVKKHLRAAMLQLSEQAAQGIAS